MRPLSGNGELILYLDYDGVLHHENVLWSHTIGAYLSAPDHYKLFQHLDLLEALLAPYPQVRIILSTSWVHRYGCAKAARQLGPRLRQRVVGATLRSLVNQALFLGKPRGLQVWEDVQRRKPRDWIALDDDGNGWPLETTGKFIKTHDKDGISHPEVLAKFMAGLEQLCSK